MKIGEQIEVGIIAGGKGERMGELTKEKPKPLLEFEGKPILGYVLDNVIQAFGSAKVCIAVGYKGEQIEKAFGSKYRNIDISYIYSPPEIESRKRLLSLKNYISSNFLFLATDLICDAEALIKVVELQEKENKIMSGTISGAIDHKPALTHALIKTENNMVTDLEFPPSDDWKINDLRDIHVACFRKDFFGILESSPKNHYNVMNSIAKAVKEGKNFQISKYCKPWYHFANPEDLKNQIRGKT